MGIVVLIIVLAGIVFAIWKLRSNSKKKDNKVSISGGGKSGQAEEPEGHKDIPRK